MWIALACAASDLPDRLPPAMVTMNASLSTAET
jgi:hypothetical protein